MKDRFALVLAEPGDPSGKIVGLALRRRGCRVARLGVRDLVRARWSHSLDGDVDTTLTLVDGTVLDRASIGVVLNRLDWPQLPNFARASPPDREYAAAEFAALLTSWLYSLEVLVANQGLGENEYAPAEHPLAWHAMAAGHGIEVADFVVASSVRGGACVGLDRVGGSAYPRGSDVAGWYRQRAVVGLDPQWLYVFGEDSIATASSIEESNDRCVAMARALGLGYAAFGFVSVGERCLLTEVLPKPPLENAEVVNCCADWLNAALRSAA